MFAIYLIVLNTVNKYSSNYLYNYCRKHHDLSQSLLMYSVQCTVYSVQCTVYSVQCTVYVVRCTL